jgi:hypothetical protein
VASTYIRPDSPFVWIRYKDTKGKWRNANSGYRKDNIGDRRQAKLVAREKTLEELASRPAQPGKTDFDSWVIPWIDQRWGHLKTVTPKYYRRYYLWWRKYLKEIGANTPATISREIVLGYMPWRKQHGGERNTAIYEMKFFGQVMEEAVQRGFARTNVARRLGLQKAEQEHKTPWTDEEIQRVGAELAKSDEFGWMHVTFLMGLFQASRLRQCAVDLRNIDLLRSLINYSNEGVKGGKGFSQPIDPDFAPILKAIVAQRRNSGKTTLCDIPPMPSIAWRKFLDSFGFSHLCHHGLRASWITRAALAGVPEAQSRRFVNHASQQIHSIYQRVTASDLAPIFGAIRQPNVNSLELLSEAKPCNDLA